MNATELAAMLPIVMTTGQATFIWGPPGIGKSSIVRQVAEARGLEVRDVRLAMCDPTDLRGIPFYDPKAEQARWAPPEFLPRKGNGVVFLDELNAAPPAVQAAAYQLVLDRRIGEYELPAGWSILAAGNRQGDMGVVYRMPSPLANRFCHLDLEADYDAWKQWAYGRGIHAGVVGFLGFRRELLHRFDRVQASRAYPTPRSWEFAARMLSAGVAPQQRLAAVAGCVGEGAALELLAYLDVAEQLPDADAILEGSSQAVPKELSTLYALVGALLYALRGNLTDDRRDNFLSYTMRIPAEFAVLAIKDGLQMGMAWRDSRKWKSWIHKFGEVVF